jgi:hypothetical protein
MESLYKRGIQLFKIVNSDFCEEGYLVKEMKLIQAKLNEKIENYRIFVDQCIMKKNQRLKINSRLELF